MTRSHASSGTSQSRRRSAPCGAAALLTSTSMRPNRASASAMKRSASVARLTSPTSVRTRRPRPWSSPARLSRPFHPRRISASPSSFSFRVPPTATSVATTSAPARANATEIARPIPLARAHPVTSTILPSNSLTGKTSLLEPSLVCPNRIYSRREPFNARGRTRHGHDWRAPMAAQDERSVPSHLRPSRGPLTGIRVVELADEQAEYCGLTLQYPALIVARMSPFGDHGPWADFKGSDLVHLALGGVMMNCGYDPAPGGKYDLPPIAPQMWHAFHIAGEQLAVAIIAALLFRWRTGRGQRLSCAIHEAVAKSTEVDLMTWVMRRSLVLRQTCRHARESVTPHPSIVHTKDGRWVMANLGTRPGESARLVELLERYGIAGRPHAAQGGPPSGGRFVPGTGPSTEKRDHGMEAVQRFVRAFTYANVPWREAQESGMLWAPLRKPHENAMDPHWLARQSCTDVEHPELGRSFRYATSK